MGYKTSNHFAFGLSPQQPQAMMIPPGSSLINVIKITHNSGIDQMNATQHML